MLATAASAAAALLSPLCTLTAGHAPCSPAPASLLPYSPPCFLQLGYALKQGIPYLVLFGEAELQQGVVKIKDLDANTEEVVAQVGAGGQLAGGGGAALLTAKACGCWNSCPPGPPAARTLAVQAPCCCRRRPALCPLPDCRETWWAGCRNWSRQSATAASCTSRRRRAAAAAAPPQRRQRRAPECRRQKRVESFYLISPALGSPTLLFSQVCCCL